MDRFSIIIGKDPPKTPRKIRDQEDINGIQIELNEIIQSSLNNYITRKNDAQTLAIIKNKMAELIINFMERNGLDSDDFPSSKLRFNFVQTYDAMTIKPANIYTALILSGKFVPYYQVAGLKHYTDPVTKDVYFEDGSKRMNNVF